MACRYAGVVGAIDGTHIKIIAPSKDEDVFVNRNETAAPLSGQIPSLYERYRFSSEGICYLVVLVGPYEGNATKRSRAQCVCVSLRFVATVGDAERISKKVPCDTQGCSCPKYTAQYVRAVSQLFANTNCQVASYQLAGKRKHLYTWMSGRVAVARQSSDSACWVRFPSEVGMFFFLLKKSYISYVIWNIYSLMLWNYPVW
ncbi:hypothetical protein N1851_029402 [Merluccius polli]|uniref:DDE Tnp4 domain-containing protein n=1 Tax=Merluccius polli TaxID=89951 RepID=A0AA47NQS8_MERPO|nr:hypothetical protein N1851_029402 [Merluccius polli]